MLSLVLSRLRVKELAELTSIFLYLLHTGTKLLDLRNAEPNGTD